MRKAFASLIIILAAVLCVCIFFARRSRKPIGKSVAALIASLIPPMIGNMLIIVTQDHIVADIGSYMYFLGMDLIMFFLARFTVRYCDIKEMKPLSILIYALLLADTGCMLFQGYYIARPMDPDAFEAFVQRGGTE